MPPKSSRLARRVGRRIRELRHEMGWNQTDLEASLDGAITQSTLSKFETGRSVPSLPTLEAIAKALGVPIAVLVLDPSADERHEAATALLRGSKDLSTNVLRFLGNGS